MTRMRLGIPAMGLVTPLGAGKQENARKLLVGTRAGLALQARVLPDRQIPAGIVTALLPELPDGFDMYQSRNNRLMLLALEEIAVEVDAARQRYGSHRIAVILGTSTSGIAEGEAAFAARVAAAFGADRFGM